MILPSEEYARYTIPIPPEVPRRNTAEFLQRQLEKKHPCFEQHYKADIRIQGWGNKRMAWATVVSDELLLSILAKERHGAWLYVREPGFHRVFRKGPVTCIHEDLGGLCLCAAAVCLAALLIVGCLPGKKHDENQLLYGEVGRGPEEDIVMEELVLEDQENEDEDEDLLIDECDLEQTVQDEDTALWQVPDDGYLVGTIFDVEGKKTVFFRNGQGKLEIKELPSDKEKS